ncbi:MAG: DNA polymerase I, partial [Gammaproteobacteria bacterium]|nr:DNA polymerase I [Gammaproteobacteria bacterium]
MSEPVIKPLVLIDGSNWLYRAFHALPPLANALGQPTGAVYGLGNMLRRLYKDYSPQRIAVVFDPRGKTFRHEIYAEYKATRDATPEDLSIQFPAIRELLEAMAMPVLQIDGIEADDVIGTLAMKAVAAGEEVVIVTGDKDLAQLVSPQIKLLDTMKNRTLDREAVIERFGVPPECIVDYLALVGDTSDNIPGVPGCGPKTAAKWLNEYGSLDALVAHADEIKGKIGEKLRAALNVLPLSHDLATIRTDIPLPLELDALQPGKADNAKLAEFYQRMGFTRWLEELGDRGGAVPAPEPVASAAAPVDYRMVATREQLRELCEALASAELICFDTETDALDAMRAGLVGLSFATRPGEAWYVPLTHDYLGAPEQLPLGEVVAAVKPMLEDPGKPKLGQHLKYDVNVLARYGIEVAGIGYDTMLESYVLDAANWRHDMDSMAQQHLGHKTISFTDVAGKGKGQLTFNQVALDKATEYAAEDADITLRLHQALYPQLEKIESLLPVFHDIEMPLVPVLARIERAGVKIDTTLLARISAEFGDRMNELQAQAWKAADTEFNLGSPAQLQTILYDKLQLPVLGRTPKGQPSTAEDVLDQLANEHELPRLILEWRGMS